MIGWKVDVGVNVTSIPSSISEINFLDTDRIMSFSTARWEGNYDSPNRLSGEEIRNGVYSYIGQDADVIYPIPIRGMDHNDIKNVYNELANYFPSIQKGFPNTLEYAFSYTRNEFINYVVYYKTLKKIFFYFDSSLRSVDDSGNIGAILFQKAGFQLIGSFLNSNRGSTSSTTRVVIEQYRAIPDYPNLSVDTVGSVVNINIGNSTTSNNYEVAFGSTSIDYISGLITLFGNSKPDITVTSNPYAPGGNSGEGGGGGSFDGTSESVSIPTLPSLSSSNTGFTRIYNPSLSQVQDLARYLWTDDTVIETIWNKIKQFFENPMNAIIGFNLVPVPVPNGGTENFKLMYIDTGVSMTVAASQFVDVDCGDLKIEKYYGSALDYSPNTKISCFLPFIGNVSLNVDEVMDKNLNIIYRVDICSGSCVAHILVDGNDMYQYSGHCAISIPLSGSDFSSYVNAAISVGKLAGAALISGAGVAASAIIGDAEPQTNKITTTTQITDTTMDRFTGEQVISGTKSIMKTVEKPNEQSSTQASFLGISPRNIANTVGQVISSKPHIEHSGSFSGNSGYLGVRRPFVIIERPNMCMPENYQHLNGFPSMITALLGSCKGYTVVQQVQLTELYATNPEQAEILELLKSGVIL